MSESVPARWYLGLMSGTSIDGIDATLVRSDGEWLERVGLGRMAPYGRGTRALIERAIGVGATIHAEADLMAEADACIADDHAALAGELLSDPAWRAVLGDERPVVGFHGQTILHEPEHGRCLQLGDPQRLADALGLSVVARFRDADLASGGQGAPLAPVYQVALLDRHGTPDERAGQGAWLNLGGIANLGLRIDGEIHGFDCGPGNTLLDRTIRARTGEPFDAGGERASRGRVDAAALAGLLDDPWFTRVGPRSLDREHVVTTDAMTRVDALPVNDALATLAAFTVQAVVGSLAALARPLDRLVVSGGGQHNRALIDGLREAIDARVVTADELGLPGDLIEAELIGFLAARHERSLPITFPNTTGVTEPCCGGRRYEPRP